MALAFCIGTFLSRQTCAQRSEWITLDEQSVCMSRAELEESIKQDLGSVEIPPELSVQVIGEGEGFLLFDGQGVVAERRFESQPPNCEAKVRVLSVVIAMAIEHHVVTSKESPEEVEERPLEREAARPAANVTPSVKAEAEVGGTGESTSESPRRPRPKRRRTRKIPEDRFAPRVAGGASYSYGVLPVAAPFWTAEAGLMFPGRWFIGGGFLSSERMRVAFEVPEEESGGLRVADEAFTKALVQLMGGTLLGCYEPAFEKGEVGLCAGIAAGRFHARGVEGFDPNSGESVPWLAGFGRAVGRAPARGPFGMSLGVDIFAHFIRPGVELVGEGSARSPRDAAPVGGAISLGTFFVIK